jgi:hypothetical protein
MNIEQIHDEWATDSEIKGSDLDGASRETPKLHAKYLRLHSQARSKMVYLEMQQKKLLKKKWLYYNGKMTKEEIEAEGWEYDPFKGLKIMKGDMNHYYDADDDIQKSEMKIRYQKECIDTLKEIVDMIKWRHQTIGNMIKNRIFEAGG